MGGHYLGGFETVNFCAATVGRLISASKTKPSPRVQGIHALPKHMVLLTKLPFSAKASTRTKCVPVRLSEITIFSVPFNAQRPMNKGRREYTRENKPVDASKIESRETPGPLTESLDMTCKASDMHYTQATICAHGVITTSKEGKPVTQLALESGV